MYIDANHHLWLLANRRGEWPPRELAAIHRDLLAPEIAAAGVSGTVLMQSLSTDADTRFMQELAEVNQTILGVVAGLT